MVLEAIAPTYRNRLICDEVQYGMGDGLPVGIGCQLIGLQSDR